MTALCERERPARYAELLDRYEGFGAERLSRGGWEVEVVELELQSIWKKMDASQREEVQRLRKRALLDRDRR
jgi:hypothetical protein